MYASQTLRKPSVVWQGSTKDGYTLGLTDSTLTKISSKLKQTGLEHLVHGLRSNSQGSLESDVVRAIAQVVNHATASGTVSSREFGRNLRAFTAMGKMRTYQILTQPINRQQSVIIFVRAHPMQEFEYESEFDRGDEIEYSDSTKLGKSRYNLKQKPMGFKRWKSGREAQHLIPKAVFKAHNMPPKLLNSPANGIMIAAGNRQKRYPIYRKPVKMGSRRPAHIKKGLAHPEYNKKVTEFLAWAYPGKKGNWSRAEVERAALALRKAHKDPSMKGKFVDDIPLPLLKKYF